MKRSVISVVLVGVGVSSSSWAAEEGCRPDDGLEASARKERGVAAYKRGEREDDPKDFQSAARCFELAHEAEPSGPVLFNAATSWVAGREPARAADAYARALSRGGLEADYEKVAKRRLAEASRELTVVDVVGPIGRRLNVAHVDAQIPTTFHLAPGAHEIRLQCPQGEIPVALTARAGDKERLDLSCPEKTKEPLPVTMRVDEGPSGLAIGGWTMVAVGGAGGAIALGLGVATLQARDEYFETRVEATRERGEGYRVGTNISGFAGLAFALAGTGMLVFDLLGEEDSDVAVGVSPLGFGLSGRW